MKDWVQDAIAIVMVVAIIGGGLYLAVQLKPSNPLPAAPNGAPKDDCCEHPQLKEGRR